MKIIHIITALGIGGAEKLLVNIVNEQVKENSVQIVYLKPINEVAHLIDKKVTIKQVPLNFNVITSLKKIFKNVNPDIIHTHLGHADLLGFWASRSSKAKVFCTIHSTYFKKNIYDNLFFKIYKLFFKSKKHPIHVISISKSVEKHVINRLKLPVKQSHLIYNAIQDKALKAKKSSSDKTNLLFVGRLTKAKSIDTLIKAIKRLQNEKISLTIVGDGSLKNELIGLSKELNLEKIINFAGKQKNTDTYYENADIFILPSVWEGFGIVILEAFRAKLPVIASNIEGPSELIENEKNGILFEPKNDVELSKKIKYLVDNKSLRKALGIKGNETFCKEFLLDVYIKKLNDLYINC